MSLDSCEVELIALRFCIANGHFNNNNDDYDDGEA